MLSLVSCTEKHPSENEIQGTWITETEYHNSFFGLSFKVPSDWSIKKTGDEEATKRAVDLLTDEKNLKRAMTAAVAKMITIVQASRYPVGTPGKENAVIVVSIESIANAPGIAFASDYLKAVQDLTGQSALNVTFTSDPHDITLGGLQFSYLESVMSMGNRSFVQRYYARKQERYVMAFILTASSAKAVADFQPILDSIHVLEGTK
jgi:hypothetical protein